MKWEIGDLIEDGDGTNGIVCIQWSDGDVCSIENDAAHPNPSCIGHINDSTRIDDEESVD